MVNEHNHYHLERLGQPSIQVKAENVGPGAATAPDDKGGQQVGLCNGARGTVYDVAWAPGDDPLNGSPVLS